MQLDLLECNDPYTRGVQAGNDGLTAYENPYEWKDYKAGKNNPSLLWFKGWLDETSKDMIE